MNREATGLAGARHRHYETLGSTNAEALALARAGERGPLWVTADTQTSGRGRRGRQWTSPAGNLYATLLLNKPSSPEVAPQLSFVAALAAYDAISAAAPPLANRLALKWPNDVLIGDAKAGGILVEGESGADFAVAVGIGINCASHPGETPYPATDLAANGAVVTAALLLRELATAMTPRLSQWEGGRGFAVVRADWLKRAAGLGQRVTVRLGDGEQTGVFQGLDETGRLLLQTLDGVEKVAAGDVFLARVLSA